MTDKTISKIKNWWYYHKNLVLLGVVVCAALLYMGLLNSRTPEPDYHVGLVTMTPYSPEQFADMEDTLRAAGQDRNGDGEVLVQLHTYNVDLADDSPNAGYLNYEVAAALDGDLVGKVSGIFLVDDPAAFQRATGGILADPVSSWEFGLYLAVRSDADTAYIRLFESLC